MVEEARPAALASKKLDEVNQVMFEAYHEGLSAHILHLGPYSEEPATIERLHQFITESGYVPRHKPYPGHHEIYLTDPRKVAPEKNRTIIRQPTQPAD